MIKDKQKRIDELIAQADRLKAEAWELGLELSQEENRVLVGKYFIRGFCGQEDYLRVIGSESATHVYCFSFHGTRQGRSVSVSPYILMRVGELVREISRGEYLQAWNDLVGNIISLNP